MNDCCRGRKYNVQARRKFTDEGWTDWTSVDDFEEAIKQKKKAEDAGFGARIIDRGTGNGDKQ